MLTVETGGTPGWHQNRHHFTNVHDLSGADAQPGRSGCTGPGVRDKVTAERAAQALDQYAKNLETLAVQARGTAAQLRAQIELEVRATTTTMSIDDVVETTGMSKFAVRRLIADGQLEIVRVGRRVLVTTASVHALTGAA